MCGWSRKLVALAAIVLLFGCAKREPVAGASVRILRVSQRNEPADLDPEAPFCSSYPLFHL